ncbi:Thiol-disulfide oxidoreductase ResA [Flavobacterium bizetiae]|uniref:Thiol-disulfide oxidoreductase ResA n=1 Tax=Flavobacterium bizetiae TaxID=2704140 RepID=A0A6J4GQ02_9FLAO|nr:TlpA disulfide reductase family protein [Flavobacterium bizetiae]CAA9201067.1 Thiol-disulfide oxidoreductase ResA [Flavobacterium bizetiae]CAD5341264.1 Thiol-disulfide oxidoreductase ResA [Flavobacterium bizetiae]CAD5349062.1 Thiol-disulfide oxidoreductase ResA [Flavobacterium bizetiae]
MKQLQLFILLLSLFTSPFIIAQNETSIEKELAESHKPNQKIQDSLSKLIKEYNLKIELETDTAKRNLLTLRLDTLWNAKDQNDINQLKLDFDFARKHPNSLKALEIMKINVGRFTGMNFYDTFVEVFQNFSPEVQNSATGKEMSERLKYFKQSKVGSIAPAFTLKDITGQTVSLSDFKEKKYVLIDFWASWCAPCLEELPYIKELYKKYHQQEFEIISVTQDQKADLWKNAIAKEKIESWKHLSVTENKATIDKDYFVYGIPHKVLIDKNGVIIGKWKGSSENNKHELQQLLKSVFEAE